MARKTVNPNKLGEYNLLHTIKTKMISGLSITTLFLIKETEHNYLSSPVWAFCARDFKGKKNKTTLSVDIPILKNKKAEEFIAKNTWDGYLEKEIENDKDSDFREAVEFLNRIFPNHKKSYFYEFEVILNAYLWGTFSDKDRDGNPIEISDALLRRRKFFTSKYKRHKKELPEEINTLWNNYKLFEGDDDERSGLYEKYYKAYSDHLYEHDNLDAVFSLIGDNSVCYPVIFNDGTADWHKKEYGKVCPYAHAGEIFFIATEDTVYFSIGRHF